MKRLYVDKKVPIFIVFALNSRNQIYRRYVKICQMCEGLIEGTKLRKAKECIKLSKNNNLFA